MVILIVNIFGYGRTLLKRMIPHHAHACVLVFLLLLDRIFLDASSSSLFLLTFVVQVRITLTRHISIVVSLIHSHAAINVVFFLVGTNFTLMKLSMFAAAWNVPMLMTNACLVTGLSYAANVFVTSLLLLAAGVGPLRQAIAATAAGCTV